MTFGTTLGPAEPAEGTLVPKLPSWTRRLALGWQQQRFDAWLAWVDAPGMGREEVAALAQKLPPEEWAGLSPTAAFSRQRDFVLGRWAARQALQAALQAELHPASVTSDREHPHSDMSATVAGSEPLRILPGVFTQPVLLVDGPARRFGVSISHRNGRAAALVFDRRHPMAVDLEAINPQQVEAFQHLVDAEERAGLKAQATSLDEVAQLCLLWTCKEALGKAMNCGLTVPPEFLAVARAGPGISLPGANGPIAGWQGTYRHCPQFAWQAWQVAGHWLTVAYPEHSRLLHCT